MRISKRIEIREAMMQDIDSETRRLMSLRGRARRRGLIVQKSRKAISPDQLGGLMIIDALRNVVISGSRYDLDIDEAETVVAVEISRMEANAMTAG